MTSFTRSITVLTTLTVVVGCGRAARPASAPATTVGATLPPCTATVVSADVTSWRAVTAEGFTFCVPPDWQRSGRLWRNGNATITWGTGEPPRMEVGTELRVVRESEAMPSTPQRDPELRRFTEEIGGRTADVWKNRFGTKYYTGARWRSPPVWIDERAASGAAAELQVRIFRTVRFPMR